jgi:hypothetical protein
MGIRKIINLLPLRRKLLRNFLLGLRSKNIFTFVVVAMVLLYPSWWKARFGMAATQFLQLV